MTGQGGESMQVVYMEIEGIKIAIQLAKDALRIAWQLLKFLTCSLKDAKYKKSVGKTNIKNMVARANANGQSMIPFTMDLEIYNKYFKKDAAKYGMLYYAFKPLKSGKERSIQIIVFEKDLAMVQDILARAKEKKIREDVKNGMAEEKAAQEFDEDNRTETMDEFAENVGAASEKEVFESEMQEQFGEDYEKRFSPKGESAGMDHEKVDKLADVINFKERAEKLRNKAVAEVDFVYDEKNEKSQIVEETETHVKVAQKEPIENGTKVRQKCVWLPKDSIVPPLDQAAGANGIRTAKLKEGTDVVIEDPAGKEKPVSMKAEKSPYRNTQNAVVADGRKPQVSLPKKVEEFDITISNNLVAQRNERAIKTRVPGTWGQNARYLWTPRKDLIDVYNGESMLTSLKRDKEYKLYSEDNQIMGTIKGESLYKNHYDPVSRWVRESAQKKPFAAGTKLAKGKGRSI